MSLLVAETVCAEDDEEFKAKLLGSTLFMSGVTSLLMTSVGAKLPLFQGAAPDYVIPLLAMAAISKEKCEAPILGKCWFEKAMRSRSSLVNIL